MSAETRQLPLFPLNTILFPGATLPLHIFEPRYQALTRACLAGDERFGVVLIAEGLEVGGPAIPHLVGTIARIATVEPLDDGRYNLMTVGERRFSIERTWLEAAGYLVGQVRLRPEMSDEPPSQVQEIVSAVRATLRDYVGRLVPDPQPVQAEIDRLSNPLRLGGVAASLLRGENARKQRILERDSPLERLRLLHVLLRRELTVLDVLARPTAAKLRRDIISPN